MVVDPDNYDVSNVRDGSVGDTSNSKNENHGFVWATDGPEEDDRQNDPDHHQNSETGASAWSQSQPREKDQSLEWGSTDSNRNDTSQKTHGENERSPHKQARAEEDDWERDTTVRNEATWTSRSAPQPQTSQRQSSEWVTTEPNSNTEPNPATHESETAAPRQTDGISDSQRSQQQHARIAIDPIDYDTEELRTVSDQETDNTAVESETEAHGFVWSEPPEQHRARIEDPTPEQYQRLLTLEGIDPKTVGEKPYLTRISTDGAGGFVIDWLEFLACEAGTEGAIDAIERYQEIGWFTENVKKDLENNIQWIDHCDGNGFDVFDRGDHLLSFAYIAKIASVDSKGMMFY